MTILKELLGELIGMFLADAAITVAVLLVVGISVALIDVAHVAPLICGGVLLVGCLLTLVGSVSRAARRRAKGTS